MIHKNEKNDENLNTFLLYKYFFTFLAVLIMHRLYLALTPLRLWCYITPSEAKQKTGAFLLAFMAEFCVKEMHNENYYVGYEYITALM